MKKHIHRHITPWVAMVIIAGIGATFTFLIWANAHQSWGYEFVYPQLNAKVSRLLTNIETLGWKTYSDESYGFKVSHPAKYSDTVSNIVKSSILNAPGTSVGPLIFIKADTQNLKTAANNRFDRYWNYMSQAESPTNYCRKQVIEGIYGSEFRVVFCLINNKEERFAHIKGQKYDVFVDGYTSGYDKTLIDTYGTASKAMSQSEFTQILSTFSFI